MIKFTCAVCLRNNCEPSFGKPTWCRECYKTRWDFYDACDIVDPEDKMPLEVYEAALDILHTNGLGPAMRHVTDNLAAASK